MIRLGQAEAADPLAGGELGQIFHPLRFGAVGIDRMHDQRALHAHGRAVAGIDPLRLARHQAVNHVARSGAAVLFRQRRPEQAELAQLGHDVAVELLLAVRHQNARHQLLLTIVARRIADGALFARQLNFQQQRIVPLKDGVFVGGNGLDLFRQSHRPHVDLLRSVMRRPPVRARRAVAPRPHFGFRRARSAPRHNPASSSSWSRGRAPAPRAGCAPPTACCCARRRHT